MTQIPIQMTSEPIDANDLYGGGPRMQQMVTHPEASEGRFIVQKSDETSNEGTWMVVQCGPVFGTTVFAKRYGGNKGITEENAKIICENVAKTLNASAHLMKRTKKTLKLDDTWSIDYDPTDKRKSGILFKNGKRTMTGISIDRPHYVSAMYRRILELEELCKSKGTNT